MSETEVNVRGTSGVGGMYRDTRSDGPSEPRGGRDVRFGYDDRPDPEPVVKATMALRDYDVIPSIVDDLADINVQPDFVCDHVPFIPKPASAAEAGENS